MTATFEKNTEVAPVDRTFSGLIQAVLTTERLSEAGRNIGVATLAGGLAGFLAAGAGSRLAMRASGFMLSRDQPGVVAFTESGARVGEISAGGTIFLLIFGTLLGVMGAYFYAMLKPWLVVRAVPRGILFGLILLALLSPFSLDRGNDDFQRIGTVWVNVLLFASLFLIYGVLIALFDGWLDRALPQRASFSLRGSGPKAIVSSAALIAGILSGLVMIQVLLLFLIIAFVGAGGMLERFQLALIFATVLILMPVYMFFQPVIRRYGYRGAYNRWRTAMLGVAGGLGLALFAGVAGTIYAIMAILGD